MAGFNLKSSHIFFPIKQNKMKNSIFNSSFFYNNYHVWYNSLSNEFLILNEILNEILLASINEDNIGGLEELHPDFFKELITKKFVIENDIDEINEVRNINKTLLNSETKYELTINPTMNCNFKCWYCYESHIKNSILNNEMIERIFKHMDYVFENLPNLEIFHLAWFGGEPLLYFDQTVKPLLEYAKNKFKNINFFSSITTNGLLIKEEQIKIFKENNLQYFQITIDGFKEEHDKIRYISKNKGSYDLIVQNIILLATNKLNVNIRINFTKSTLENIEEVANYFKNYSQEVLNYVTFDFHQVWQDNEDLEDLLNLKIQYFKTIGLISTSRDETDSFKTPCYADKKNHATINYNGEVFKCTARDFKSAIKEGDLLESGEIKWNNKYFKRLEAKIKNEPCFNCKILPICGGGCSQISLENEGKNYCVKDFDESKKIQIVKNRFKNLVSIN